MTDTSMYCCAQPQLTFSWQIGNNQHDLTLRVYDIRCIACGRYYVLLNEQGDFARSTLLDVYVETHVMSSKSST